VLAALKHAEQWPIHAYDRAADVRDRDTEWHSIEGALEQTLVLARLDGLPVDFVRPREMRREQCENLTFGC
jgi:hypothetical protein